MKRNLITQIKNEWRDNLWLVVELMIVSVAIWYLAFTLSWTLKPKFESKGFDVENVYRVDISNVSQDSPDYIDLGENKDAAMLSDMRTIIRRIRRSPYVEAAAFSSNALPYQYNFMGNNLKVVGSEDSIQYNGNVRIGSPEIIRIIRPESVDGISLEDMESQLVNGRIFISPRDFYYSVYRNVRDLIGKRVVIYNDTLNPKTIGGLIKSIRRTEYETEGGTILMGMDDNDDTMLSRCSEIAVRIKPGMSKQFEEEFYSDPDMRRLRNVYLTHLVSMTDARADSQHSKDTDVRRISFGIVFLLAIIFLGLLGTFWFRIRQRMGEIALRKTCGATSADIFRRIIGEGFLLLAIATVPAIAFEALLYFKVVAQQNPEYFKWYGIAALGISILLMCIIITVGIIFPARKAMAIEPAIALKEE